MVELYIQSGFATEPDLLIKIGYVVPTAILFTWFCLSMVYVKPMRRWLRIGLFCCLFAPWVVALGFASLINDDYIKDAFGTFGRYELPILALIYILPLLIRAVFPGYNYPLTRLFFQRPNQPDNRLTALYRRYPRRVAFVMAGVAILLFGVSVASRELRTCGWTDTTLGISGCVKEISAKDSQAIKYSSNGSLIAVSGYSDKINLLNPANGTTVREISRTSSRGFASLAFSPDGKLLAGLTFDNTLQIWQTSDGALLQTLPIQIENSVLSGDLKFSPDSQLLAAGTTKMGVKIWQVKDMAIVHEFPAARNSLTFSPDGTTMATIDKDSSQLQLWRINDWQLLTSLKKDKLGGKLTFSPDGKQVYIAEETITAWNIVDGTFKKIVELDKDQILQNAAFSPDGKLVATVNWNRYTVDRPDDSVMVVWNLADGKSVMQTPVFGWGYAALSFSSNSQTIAIQAPGGVRFWRVKNG